VEEIKVNTALTIVFIAGAVMLIGGLAAMSLTKTAMAEPPDFQYCAHGVQRFPGGGVCGSTIEECEFARDLIGVIGHCHPEPINEEEE
jgi:hypothetical protein